MDFLMPFSSLTARKIIGAILWDVFHSATMFSGVAQMATVGTALLAKHLISAACLAKGVVVAKQKLEAPKGDKKVGVTRWQMYAFWEMCPIQSGQYF